ncbi:MFS transporter, partial [Kitasatospora sp. NPDC057542]
VRLLPSDQLAAGLALQGMAFQVSMLAGPALAGLVLAQWRFPAAYGLQACAVLISAMRARRWTWACESTPSVCLPNEGPDS